MNRAGFSARCQELKEKYSFPGRARHCKSFDMVQKLETLSCIHPITKLYPGSHISTEHLTFCFNLLAETGAPASLKSQAIYSSCLITASHADVAVAFHWRKSGRMQVPGELCCLTLSTTLRLPARPLYSPNPVSQQPQWHFLGMTYLICSSRTPASLVMA